MGMSLYLSNDEPKLNWGYPYTIYTDSIHINTNHTTLRMPFNYPTTNEHYIGAAPLIIITPSFMSTSALHSILTVASSIHDSAGSRGNSTIPRIRFVKAPRSVRAPKFHSWYIELRIFSYMCHRERERKKEHLLQNYMAKHFHWTKSLPNPATLALKKYFILQ